MISSTCVQILKQLDTFLRCQHAPVLYIILCAEQNLWTTKYFRFSKRWCLCMWCKLNTWYLSRCGRKLNQRWLVVSHGTGTLTHGGEVLPVFVWFIHLPQPRPCLFFLALYFQSPDTQNATLLFVLRAIRKSEVVLFACRSKRRDWAATQRQLEHVIKYLRTNQNHKLFRRT